MPASPSAPPSAMRSQAAVIFIFITVLIDVLGFGIIIPVLPELVQQMMGGDAAHGAAVYGVFGAAWALMQFIFSPLLGSISDRFGRRPVVLISCFGLGLDYIVMALAPNLGWLLFGRIVSGICSSSVSVAGAYIADVSPPDKRAAGYGMIGAAFGLGFVVGPALGGWLGHVDPRLPFWGAAAMALINAGYGLFVLPESLPPERRDVFRWSSANPVASLALLRTHRELRGLAWISFLYQLAHCVLPSMYVLYTAYRYGWSGETIGWTLTAVGGFSIIVQGGLVKPAAKWLGERRMLYAGLLFGMAGFAGFALAPDGFWMWAALPVFALWGLINPGLQTLMSHRVSVHEQGKLQGAISSITGIAGMVGPFLFTQTFVYFIDKGRAWPLPGAPFLLASGLLLLALLLAKNQRGDGSSRPGRANVPS
ncbi:TCR/Tet family MFS transporter [Paraburkholderia sediminicola]|uniref:TCR/Tet family MFS transporter n=1 Tax=Paraburkholderia sediminicola TaxID=458836 RepID=UPI0038B7D1FC